MKLPRLRAGIIGLGFIGAGDQVSGDRLGQSVANLDGHHRGALSNHPCIDLVSGSSRDSGRRERFQAVTGAKTYSNWQEMLQQEHLDLVSIATMTPDHPSQTIGCAEAGVRAVYCEKPIAPTLADAERMIAACRKQGTLLVVNHNRRFHPHFRQLTNLIRASGLGQLVTASLSWGSGRLGNVGTHFIDALRMLTGREVLAVSATLDLSARPDCRGAEFRDPGGWAVFRMEQGLIATLNAPDYAQGPGEIRISGSLGQVKVQGFAVQFEYWDGRQEYWPHETSSTTTMDIAVNEIVESLDNGTPVVSSGDSALQDLEIILGCHVSHARSAAWTELPLSGADRQQLLRSG